MDNNRRASTSEIMRYAFGGLGSNVAYILVMSYLTFFMTDIFGVSGYVISGMMLVARIIDAVTDPLMGMIADNTKSKMGRFRPYVFWGAPFLGLTIFLLFSTPSLSESGKVIWAYAIYIIYSLASTVVNVPYHSLTPVMSGDAVQRTTVVTAKQAMSVPASLFVGVLGLPLVNAFGGGAAGWQRYGLFVAVLTTLSFWICAWGAKKKDTMDLVPVKKESIPFTQQLKLIYKNKPLLMLLFAFSTDQFAAAAASAVNVHYFTYYLGRQDMVSWAAMYSLALNVVMFFLIPFLTKLAGKKKLYMISTFLILIPYTVMFFVPRSGVWAIIWLTLAAGGLGTLTGTIGWAMLPDCVEYAQWKFGIRGDGIISSSLTFANKVGMALGGSIMGILIAKTGYVAGQEQTEGVLLAFRAMKFLFPIAGYICSLVSMSFYCITEKFFSQMMEDMKNGVKAEDSILSK